MRESKAGLRPAPQSLSETTLGKSSKAVPPAPHAKIAKAAVNHFFEKDWSAWASVASGQLASDSWLPRRSGSSTDHKSTRTMRIGLLGANKEGRQLLALLGLAGMCLSLVIHCAHIAFKFLSESAGVYTSTLV
jgi:hypothetical protein